MGSFDSLAFNRGLMFVSKLCTHTTALTGSEKKRFSHPLKSDKKQGLIQDKPRMFLYCREEEVQRCENVLYAESSTLGGQPQMMPVVFQKTAMELDEMLQKLEAAILDTITDINNKKKVRWWKNIIHYLNAGFLPNCSIVGSWYLPA